MEDFIVTEAQPVVKEITTDEEDDISKSHSSSLSDDEGEICRRYYDDGGDGGEKEPNDSISNVDILTEILKAFCYQAELDFNLFSSCGCKEGIASLQETISKSEASDAISDTTPLEKQSCKDRTEDLSLSTEDVIWTTTTVATDKHLGEKSPVRKEKGGYSVLEEHARINLMLKNSKGFFLHVKDPHMLKTTKCNSFDKKRERKHKGYQTKEFFVKTLNTNENYSFFESVSDYLYGADKSNASLGTRKTWKETMLAVLDYTSRLCFGVDLEVLAQMDDENVFSSFIIHAIPKNLRDSKSCETEAKFSFVYRFFQSFMIDREEVSFVSNGLTTATIVNDIPRNIVDFKINQTANMSNFLLLLANKRKLQRSIYQRYDAIVAFVFEPIVCCMYRTGIVSYGYDPYSESIFPMRNYINSVVADETRIFMYIIEFSGVIDNLMWCKERKQINIEIIVDNAIHRNEKPSFSLIRHPGSSSHGGSPSQHKASCTHLSKGKVGGDVLFVDKFRSSKDVVKLKSYTECDTCIGVVNDKIMGLLKCNAAFSEAYINYRALLPKDVKRSHEPPSQSSYHEYLELKHRDDDDDRFRSNSTITFVTVPSHVLDEDCMFSSRADVRSQRAPRKSIFEIPPDGHNDNNKERESKRATATTVVTNEFYLPKIKVNWSNITNGCKDDLTAHIVFDGQYDVLRVGNDGGDDNTGDSRRWRHSIVSLSAFKCVCMLFDHYEIKRPRVYELDMTHYSFKTAAVPFMTIDPNMCDMKDASLIVFQYDYDDINAINGTFKKNKNQNGTLAMENMSETIKAFKCVYYRNGIEFLDKENIVDEGRASFPLNTQNPNAANGATKENNVGTERWRISKLYFVWFKNERDGAISSSSSFSSFGISNVEIKLFSTVL